MKRHSGCKLLIAAVALAGSLLSNPATASEAPADLDLLYSSYMGGSDGLEVGYATATDATGAIYVAGATSSSDFPIVNAAQPQDPGNVNGFVAKFAADGTLLYSTFLGGNNVDQIDSIAIDTTGRAWVTGYTRSANFPVTSDAFQATHGAGDSDAFVARYSPSGDLEYSTFLGGRGWDRATELVVDDVGDVYVTGVTGSVDFPTAHALQPTKSLFGDDAFLTKLTSSGRVVYSTYFGGGANEFGEGVAVDAQRRPYLTGITMSPDFPTNDPVGPIYVPGVGGSTTAEAYVARLSSSGTELEYSTVFGGEKGENGQDVVVDDAGNAYVTGLTESRSFPTTAGAFQPTAPGGAFDAFAVKLSPEGKTVYSTYLGGSGYDHGHSVAVDDRGVLYLSGTTASPNFPTAAAFQPIHGGGNIQGRDGYVAMLDPAGAELFFSSFLGGSGEEGAYLDLDDSGSLLLTGHTTSTNFPLAGSAAQTTLNGRIDVFRAVLGPPGVASSPQITFTDRSASSGQYSDAVTLEAQLTDGSGVPLSGRELTFELAGLGSSRTFTASTQDGLATVTPTLTEQPGDYTISVIYEGPERSASANVPFVVEKEDSALTLSTEGKGKGRTLTARISHLDSPDSGIEGRKIEFYADGELLGSAVTEASGTATLDVPPRYRGGNHDFAATFDGDDYYRPSSTA